MACCLMAPSHYLNQCWLIIHVAFTSQRCYKKHSRYEFIKWVWKLYFLNYWHISLGQWVKPGLRLPGTMKERVTHAPDTGAWIKLGLIAWSRSWKSSTQSLDQSRGVLPTTGDTANVDMKHTNQYSALLLISQSFFSKVHISNNRSPINCLLIRGMDVLCLLSGLVSVVKSLTPERCCSNFKV